jgi:23S rRNA U2552 (ribose-2'-O)-methylase RlmE/FtsJ
MWSWLSWKPEQRERRESKRPRLYRTMDLNEQKPPWKQVAFCTKKHALFPQLLMFEEWHNEFVDKELVEEKEKLSKYESQHIWELAKKMANPYECVYTQDDSHFHPSLCIYRPLSRSFFKMIEILSVLEFFERLPKQQIRLRSAHIAEGPGGFIEALYERAELYRRTVNSSLAMTLKPTDYHTPGWKRAASFLQKHRQIQLHYGIDGTGDIYQKGNQDSFVKQTKPGVHLFTADGGFDFSANYSFQEMRAYHLLVCSALIGLQSMASDGCLVIKFFDIQENPTQILILLISSCFREWTLYKPATSRPCNAERYLLCRGFRSLPPEVLQLLEKIEEESLKGKYPYFLNKDSILQSEEFQFFQKNTQQVVTLQKWAIKTAESYIQNPVQWKSDFAAHFQKGLEWCTSFRIPVLQKRPIDSAVTSVVLQMSQRVSRQQLQRPDAV